MKIIQENLAPQVTIEIDRRRNLIAGGECETRVTVGQRLKAIVAIGKLEIVAVHINMGLDSRRDRIR
ncbi:hypothetical protein D9M68_848690 [compost metagenome]